MLADAKEESSIYAELEKNYGDTFGRIVQAMRASEGSEVSHSCENLGRAGKH